MVASTTNASKLVAGLSRPDAEELRVLVRQPIDHVPSTALLQTSTSVFYNTDDPTSDALRHLGVAFSSIPRFRNSCLTVPTSLVHDLGQGIPNNFTTEVSLDLWQLAEEARPLAAVFAEAPPDELFDILNTTEKGRRWWAQFEEVLMRHGHRGEVELDITAPRWREAPRFLLHTITNYLRHPEDHPSPAEILKKAIGCREAAAAEIRATLPQPMRLLFDWLYFRYVSGCHSVRPAKYTGYWAGRSRRSIGTRAPVVAAGHLRAIDDVFWLHLGELGVAESNRIPWSAAVLKEREQQWVAWSCCDLRSLDRKPRGRRGSLFLVPATLGTVTSRHPGFLRTAVGIARS